VIRHELVKLEEALALKELNEELLDATHSLLVRTLQFCKKNRVPFDDGILALSSRVGRILGEIQNPPPQRKHPDRTPQESTVYLSVQDKLNIDIIYQGVDLGRFQKYLEAFHTLQEVWLDGLFVGMFVGGVAAVVTLLMLAH
jgi:hypothetical protein